MKTKYNVNLNGTTVEFLLEEQHDGSWMLTSENFAELVAFDGDRPTDEDVAQVLSTISGLEVIE